MLKQLFNSLISNIREYCAPKTAVTALSTRMSEAESNIDDKLGKGDVSLTPTYHDVISENFVDLGLSVLWQRLDTETYNPGSLYAWGEVESKRSFTIDNYQYYSDDEYTRYNDEDEIPNLLPEDDASTAHWANYSSPSVPSRIPTFDEYQELVDNCVWRTETRYYTQAETVHAVAVLVGYSIVPGYESSRIEFPIASGKNAFWLSNSSGSAQNYLVTVARAYQGSGNSGTLEAEDEPRYSGMCVRGVVPKSAITVTGSSLYIGNNLINIPSKAYVDDLIDYNGPLTVLVELDETTWNVVTSYGADYTTARLAFTQGRRVFLTSMQTELYVPIIALDSTGLRYIVPKCDSFSIPETVLGTWSEETVGSHKFNNNLIISGTASHYGDEYHFSAAAGSPSLATAIEALSNGGNVVLLFDNNVVLATEARGSSGIAGYLGTSLVLWG